MPGRYAEIHWIQPGVDYPQGQTPWTVCAVTKIDDAGIHTIHTGYPNGAVGGERLFTRKNFVAGYWLDTEEAITLPRPASDILKEVTRCSDD